MPHSAAGEVVETVLRFKSPHDPRETDAKPGKWFLPVSKVGATWQFVGLLSPRPLYGLPQLLVAPVEEPVYVCEGEKAADAARALRLLATTSPHGSNSANKCHWSVMNRRNIVVLADHDEAGEKYVDTDTPTASLAASETKNRKSVTQPIRAEFAKQLAPWLATKAKGVPLALLPEKKAAAVLAADLANARATWIDESADAKERKQREESDMLLYVDSRGRVADFHALRVTFVSRVLDAGASLKEAMELARHSDPPLTTRTYGRVGLHSLARVLEAMPHAKSPSTTQTERSRLRATGTDDETPVGTADYSGSAANKAPHKKHTTNPTTRSAKRGKLAHKARQRFEFFVFPI